MSEIPFQEQFISERRRRNAERIDDMRVKTTSVTGRVLIFGLGKKIFSVSFPVLFSKKPNFTFGAEMAEGFVVSDEFETLPRIHPVVLGWDTIGQVAGATEGRFGGCQIGVTAEGYDATQQMWLHYSFIGPALRNPVRSLDLLDEDL